MKENVFSLHLKEGEDVVMLTVTLDNLRTMCPIIVSLYMDSGNYLIYSLKNYPHPEIFRRDLRQNFSLYSGLIIHGKK